VSVAAVPGTEPTLPSVNDASMPKSTSCDLRRASRLTEPREPPTPARISDTTGAIVMHTSLLASTAVA
jgi:hypothetical protein